MNMVGWKLFQHAVHMIVRNFSFLVRNTLPIWVIFVLGSSMLFGRYAIDPAALQDMGPQVFNGVVAGFFYIVASTWIAVVWHRYVLVEEQSSGLLPPFNGRLVWHYFVTSLVNACCLIPVVIVSALLVGVAGAILSFLGPLFIIPMAICFLPVIWAGFRLGLRLPASAVDRPLRITESWEASANHKDAIWVLAAVYMFVAFFVPALINLIFGWTPIYPIIAAILEWLAMLLAVSVLTALYGHIVEGRPV